MLVRFKTTDINPKMLLNNRIDYFMIETIYFENIFFFFIFTKIFWFTFIFRTFFASISISFLFVYLISLFLFFFFIDLSTFIESIVLNLNRFYFFIVIVIVLHLLLWFISADFNREYFIVYLDSKKVIDLVTDFSSDFSNTITIIGFVAFGYFDY